MTESWQGGQRADYQGRRRQHVHRLRRQLRAAHRGARQRARRRGAFQGDRARDELQALRSEGLSFELEEIDIESDDRLLSRFLERIPVIELEGEIVSELWLDADGIRARLGTLSG